MDVGRKAQTYVWASVGLSRPKRGRNTISGRPQASLLSSVVSACDSSARPLRGGAAPPTFAHRRRKVTGIDQLSYSYFSYATREIIFPRTNERRRKTTRPTSPTSPNLSLKDCRPSSLPAVPPCQPPRRPPRPPPAPRLKLRASAAWRSAAPPQPPPPPPPARARASLTCEGVKHMNTSGPKATARKRCPGDAPPRPEVYAATPN